ncbi:MAG: MBL fold metallo-hydrolase [Phycisphaerae bacterium]|jgi:metallo-beta-lactamase family protein|nr:MBL fold metallo-hydrolase [Phycisphaerae bacterium]HQL53893.1 MBL fold metallo-hydrolase [Phycisphaerae bacterium]
MAEILFHGAAEEVTGSMHAVRVDGQWVALDCGMYQGKRAEAEEKNRQWPVSPKDIAAVVLSHAHIDHSGRLPLLVKEGFDGPVYATPATRDLCAIMLPDSAHVQEEDVYYVSKRRKRKGLPPIEPLYDYEDALAAVTLIHSIPYGRWFPVVPGLLASFSEAGHMLGSAGIRLAFGKRNGDTPSLFYSGDMGRPDKPILRDPAPLPEDDTILMESTYGARINEAVDDARDMMRAVISRTLRRGGKVIIPSFAVGRTQTIVYYLHEQMVTGALPRIPVYVDSPLAVNATEVFKLHPECYDAEARAFHRVTGDILGSGCCTYIRNVEESKALHLRKEPCIIISASGMCEAGRIRHHLKNNITNPRNTILIPGYQAANTLGRRIADGAKMITLFHEEYEVQAEVVQIHGFSGHADQAELLRMLGKCVGTAKRLVLVHGEPDQSTVLADKARALGFREVAIAQRGFHLGL